MIIPLTLLRSSFDRLQYFVNGPNLINRQYGKVCSLSILIRHRFNMVFDEKNFKSPYMVSTPGNPLFLIASKSQIEELSKAPETQLSLHSIASDVTMSSHLAL